MKRQGGFTLIEMVVVIVILGILAVTAAPRFLNLQGDARASTMEGLKGAINGANGIVYGKAAIEGKEKDDGSSTPVMVDDIETSFGYPVASEKGLTKALKLDLFVAKDGDTAEHKGEWRVAYADSKAYYTLSALTVETNDAAGIQKTKCYVEYAQAADKDSEPKLLIVNSGC